MGFLHFGKKFNHRRFEYIPRFYDPDKDELESRLKKYKSLDVNDFELTKARIKGGFRRKYRVGNEYTQKSNRRSNRILIYTLLFLFLLTFIFISKYLPKIIASFE